MFCMYVCSCTCSYSTMPRVLEEYLSGGIRAVYSWNLYENPVGFPRGLRRISVTCISRVYECCRHAKIRGLSIIYLKLTFRAVRVGFLLRANPYYITQKVFLWELSSCSLPYLRSWVAAGQVTVEFIEGLKKSLFMTFWRRRKIGVPSLQNVSYLMKILNNYTRTVKI